MVRILQYLIVFKILALYEHGARPRAQCLLIPIVKFPVSKGQERILLAKKLNKHRDPGREHWEMTLALFELFLYKYDIIALVMQYN